MSMVNKEPYITPEMIQSWSSGSGSGTSEKMADMTALPVYSSRCTRISGGYIKLNNKVIIDETFTITSGLGSGDGFYSFFYLGSTYSNIRPNGNIVVPLLFTYWLEANSQPSTIVVTNARLKRYANGDMYIECELKNGDIALPIPANCKAHVYGSYYVA